MKIYQSSRRTINSGEVVTFATGFQEYDGVFGKAYKPTGCFNISASRDEVISHHAYARNQEELDALIQALQLAYEAKVQLKGRYGEASLFSSEPTECVHKSEGI